MIPAFLSQISPHPPAVAAVLFTDLIVLAVAPVCFPNDRSSEASPSLMARARKSYLWPPSTLLVATYVTACSIQVIEIRYSYSIRLYLLPPTHGDIPTSHISNGVGAVATRHLYRSPFDNRLRWRKACRTTASPSESASPQ
ncbi:hypothetical protein B0H14DRAFT_3471703 [Mycena olivaceomarginata]|nr:hypothetical protein B0H14DRAFT_3471703 [Mycena olivaceomarginata]